MKKNSKRINLSRSRWLLSVSALRSLLWLNIAGEEIIIAKSGKPVAKLVPFKKPIRNRKPGSAKGKIFIADDFDAPLPDDILEEFYKYGVDYRG